CGKRQGHGPARKSGAYAAERCSHRGADVIGYVIGLGHDRGYAENAPSKRARKSVNERALRSRETPFQTGPGLGDGPDAQHLHARRQPTTTAGSAHTIFTPDAPAARSVRMANAC